ncbi:MAG: DUF5615 family PIN-like protein [Nevskia sp.]|nr:DUF5615 family PIN-like protein [Nevskia sp.]
MKFLLDANMPRAAVRAVLARRHDAEHIRDTALRDAADELVAAYALASGAVLVSRDLDSPTCVAIHRHAITASWCCDCRTTAEPRRSPGC